jgi:hypothetical protein
VRDQPDCDLDGLIEGIDYLFLHSKGIVDAWNRFTRAWRNRSGSKYIPNL